MWASVIAVAFGGAALVVYFKGAKKDKPWAKPLMALLVLGAVVSVILPRTPFWKEMTRPRVERNKGVRMMGEALRKRLPFEPRVLVIRHKIDPQMQMTEMPSQTGEEQTTLEGIREKGRKEVKEAFEKGFGREIVMVGYEPPGLTEEYFDQSLSTAEFNRVFSEYQNEGIDLCISMIGLPKGPDKSAELQDMALSDLGPDVLFFADLGLKYDPDELRAYIQDGLLDGAVIHPSTASRERRVITRDTLEQLPDEPPTER